MAHLISQLLEPFEEIWISEDAAESDVSARIVDQLRGSAKIKWVPSAHQGSRSSRATFSDQAYSKGKRTLWLKKFEGQFFKRCPGSTQKKSALCCNYHVLNLGSQCNFDCSYCYLQSYLTQPEVQIYTNIDEAMDELSRVFDGLKDQHLRVGTGEIIDSLSLDPLTLYSRKLIELFRNYPHWKLEFKTKSDHVDQFLDTPHANNVVVGFSINPAIIVDREEKRTASVARRLFAARKARDRGFLISFHLDPLIYFPEWETHYGALVDQIIQDFLPHELDVISIGSLRFQPEQKQIMRERHGFQSLVNQAEMFQSREGKLRYDFRLRNEMYQFILRKFKNHSEAWRIFFCMESPETWIESYEKTPSQIPGLQELFKPVKYPSL